MRRLSRNQRGETLIELLLTMFIMSTVLVSLLALLMTVIAGSASHRATVSAGNQVTTIAEQLDKVDYVACGGAGNPVSTYQSKMPTVVSGYTGTLVSVEYLSSSTSDNQTFTSSCPGGGDKGTQRITLRVKLNRPPGSSAEVKLIKRNQQCPVGMGAQLQPGQKC